MLAEGKYPGVSSIVTLTRPQLFNLTTYVIAKLHLSLSMSMSMSLSKLSLGLSLSCLSSLDLRSKGLGRLKLSSVDSRCGLSQSSMSLNLNLCRL